MSTKRDDIKELYGRIEALCLANDAIIEMMEKMDKRITRLTRRVRKTELALTCVYKCNASAWEEEK